jgi:carboxyl-terminal processing protease
MKKPLRAAAAYLATAVVCATAGFAISMAAHPETRVWFDPGFWKAWLRVGHAMRLASTHYLDPAAASREKITQSALTGIGSSLDKYSAYLPPADYDDFNLRNNQTRTGIGAGLQIFAGYPVIANVLHGGGAEEAGLKPGDRLLKAGDTRLNATTAAAAAALLRGDEGANVVLEIWRDGEGTLTRHVPFRRFHVPSVEGTRLLDKRTGYFRINEFKRHTAGETAVALATLTLRGATRLVLDLRGNPGGNIEAAVDAAGLFLPLGTVVSTLQGRDGSAATRHVTKHPPTAPRIAVAILVDHTTASSAEILSGALQDLRRAVVVGEATRGKHVAQTIYELGGGDALRLTTARYTLPGGRSTQHTGVVPDVHQSLDWRTRQLVRLGTAWRAMGLEREFVRLHGAPPPEDLQLTAAIDTLNALAPKSQSGSPRSRGGATPPLIIASAVLPIYGKGIPYATASSQVPPLAARKEPPPGKRPPPAHPHLFPTIFLPFPLPGPIYARFFQHSRRLRAAA